MDSGRGAAQCELKDDSDSQARSGYGAEHNRHVEVTSVNKGFVGVQQRGALCLVVTWRPKLTEQPPPGTLTVTKLKGKRVLVSPALARR